MANEYWRTREEQALAEYQLTDDEYVKQLNDIYDYMVDQINREIRGFYSKYADAEGITMAEAAKRASELDMDEYSRKAKKYVAEKDFSAQANREMRLYNMTMKVNRLELLKSNIGLEMVDGFQDIEDLFGDSLTERARDEFRRQAGILGNTVHDSAKNAKSIVGASFHNANWSDRIWMYQGMLRDELSTLLTQGMIQGRNPNELARHINNLFDAGKYNCERLMRTEMTRVQSDAQLQSFIANGFDEYQFNALGDACPDCKALDEQHFKITDAEPGENLPPIHPNCRCAVSAWMDDTNYNEWLDSYADHGMSYEDWLENRPTAVGGSQEELYKEWMDSFFKGGTSLSFDKWLESRESGGAPSEEAKKPEGIGKTKNFEQLEKYLRDNYHISVDDSVKELNFSAVREAMTGVEDMIQQFPSLQYSIRNLSTDSFGCMNCNGSTICFNPKDFTTKSSINASLKKNNGGWWVNNVSVASMGVHECAHAVERILIDRQMTGIMDEGQALEDWINHTMATGIVDTALGTVKGASMKSISGYAATQKSECFAEAFADVYANGDKANPLSMEITRLTQEQYNRGTE